MKRTLVNTYRAVSTRIPRGTPVNMRFANLPPIFTPSFKSYLIGDRRNTIQLEDFDMIPGRAYFFAGEWKFGLISPWFGFKSGELGGVDLTIQEKIQMSSASGNPYQSLIVIPGTHVGTASDVPAFYAQADCGFTAVDDLFTGTIYEFSYSNPYAAYAGGGLSYPSEAAWNIPIIWPLACRVDRHVNSYFDRCSVELPLEDSTLAKSFFTIVTSPSVTHPLTPFVQVSFAYTTNLYGSPITPLSATSLIDVPTNGVSATAGVPDQASINTESPSSGFKMKKLKGLPMAAFANYPVPATATLLRLNTGGRIAG